MNPECFHVSTFADILPSSSSPLPRAHQLLPPLCHVQASKGGSTAQVEEVSIPRAWIKERVSSSGRANTCSLWS